MYRTWTELTRRTGVFWAAASLVWIAGVPLGGCGPGDTENRRPQLSLDVGAQETYVVGEDVIQIRMTATDPDGDSLSFDVDGKPEEAEFQVYANEALFKWSPITSDVTRDEPKRLTFIAKDDRGARTEKVVEVTIRPGNGVPNFSNTPSSTLHDAGSSQPVEVDIEVRDDDSSEVELTMPSEEAPTGARFKQTDPKKGTFTWEPGPDQKDVRVHTAVFVADDGTNDPVRHKLTIIIKNQNNTQNQDPPDEMESCDQEQTVEFDPLPAQRTLKDYPIEAKLNPSIADRYDRASVWYTTGDPLNNPDETFKSARLELDGRTLSGSIPNLEVPKGESKTVFYAVCALDSEADAEAENGVICSPNRGFHSFIAYSPDVNVCLDDGQGIDTPESAAQLSTTRWERYRLCKDNKDLHELTLSAGETLEVFVYYPFGQEIDLRVLGPRLEPSEKKFVTKSPCRGLAVAEMSLEKDAPQTTVYLEVTGEDIPYQIAGRRSGGDMGGECEPDDEEPNDSADNASLVVDDKTFEGLSICPGDDIDVYVVELLKGDVFGANLEFTHADGNIDASLFAPSADLDGDSAGIAKSWSDDDGETLTHRAIETGLFHLVVFSGGDSNEYDLTVASACRDNDQFSDNHTRDKAAVAGVKTYQNLKICPGQADWYQRTGFEGAALKATLDVESGARLDDITFRAVDESGTEVATATRDGGNLVIDHTPSSGEQLYFEVRADTDFTYTLQFEQE